MDNIEQLQETLREENGNTITIDCPVCFSNVILDEEFEDNKIGYEGDCQNCLITVKVEVTD